MRFRSFIFSVRVYLWNMERRTVYSFATCFALWIAYASLYTTRKPLGIVKSTVERELSLTRSQIGLLDVAFTLPYAAVQTFWSNWVDLVHPRLLLLLGIGISSFGMLAISYAETYAVFFVSLFVVGASTSLMWPVLTKTTQMWYRGSPKLNFVFGVMGTSTFVGGVVATLSSSALFSAYGWRYTYFFFFWVLISISGFCFVVVKLPQDIVGLSSSDSASTISPKSPQSFLVTLRRPYILHFSAANFLIKMMRYFLYFWLPMYLEQQLSYSAVQAGYLSASYDLGGSLGPLILGYLMDRLSSDRPADLIACSIILSTTSLIVFYMFSSFSFWICFLSLVAAGFFSCGVDPMLSGSIPQETAGAAGAGLVNGFGTFGALIEGPLAGLLSSATSWSTTLGVFVCLSSLAGVIGIHAALTKGLVLGMTSKARTSPMRRTTPSQQGLLDQADEMTPVHRETNAKD